MPFDDVTVLDLSHAMAGPFCLHDAGGLGARVVKIEPPGRATSRAPGARPSRPRSAYFVGLNRNKRSVEIDLKHARARIFFRLM